jgi:hypothetical protein
MRYEASRFKITFRCAFSVDRMEPPNHNHMVIFMQMVITVITVGNRLGGA